jgi:hypothetical protein
LNDAATRQQSALGLLSVFVLFQSFRTNEKIFAHSPQTAFISGFLPADHMPVVSTMVQLMAGLPRAPL